MEYYLINIICNFFLLLVIRQFLGDFLQFETDNRIKRAVFSVCWLVGTFEVNELLHVPVVNLLIGTMIPNDIDTADGQIDDIESRIDELDSAVDMLENRIDDAENRAEHLKESLD